MKSEVKVPRGFLMGEKGSDGQGFRNLCHPQLKSCALPRLMYWVLSKILFDILALNLEIIGFGQYAEVPDRWLANRIPSQPWAGVTSIFAFQTLLVAYICWLMLCSAAHAWTSVSTASLGPAPGSPFVARLSWRRVTLWGLNPLPGSLWASSL